IAPNSTLFPYTTLFRSEEQRHHQRDEWEAARDGKGEVQVAVLGEPAAEDADDHRGAVDRGPLHGLEGARETARPSILDHQRVHRSEEHTSELQSRVDLV